MMDSSYESMMHNAQNKAAELLAENNRLREALAELESKTRSALPFVHLQYCLGEDELQEMESAIERAKALLQETAT